MEKKQLKVYNDRAYGEKVSRYGLENGYLDYLTLSKIVGDCILNNTIREATACEWELMVGGQDEDITIFQEYIITEDGYRFLREYTDEIVIYNEKLDIYLWGVTHFGTSWGYVLTDIELVRE